MKRCLQCEEKYNKSNKERSKNRREKNKMTHYRRYNEPRSTRLRKSVLAEFKGLCVVCYCNGRVVSNGRMIIHHIEPSTEETFYDRENLTCLCFECHERVHSTYDFASPYEVQRLKDRLREYRSRFLEEMSI